MEGLKMYIPALILFDTNSVGFSTNLSIFPVACSYTTTPYLDGSSTFVTYKVRNLSMNIIRSMLNKVKQQFSAVVKLMSGLV